MDGNHYWQDFRARERVAQQLREAEAHRLARQGKPPRRSIAATAGPVMLLAAGGLLLLIWLLTGCTAGKDLNCGQPTPAEWKTAAAANGVHPAGRQSRTKQPTTAVTRPGLEIAQPLLAQSERNTCFSRG